MKQWKKVLAVLAAAMTLSLGAACMAYAAEGEISVNGTGIVQVKPDTADISFNIETSGKTAQAAQKENNQINTAVTKAMTDLGITKENILTTYSAVYPSYRYDDETGKRILTGYRAATELQVTTKDIDHTGKYIDAALQAGATGFDGVSFSLANQNPYYGQALQAAVKNAETSATAIAQAYGKSLGEVKSVKELSYHAYEIDTAKETLSQMKAESAMDSAAGTEISYGKIQITANLAVVYTF